METQAAILFPAKMLVKKSVKIDKCRYTKTEFIIQFIIYRIYYSSFIFFC